MTIHSKTDPNLQCCIIGVSAVISDLGQNYEMVRFVSKLSLSIFSKGGKIMQVYDPVFSPVILNQASLYKSVKGGKLFHMLIDDSMARYVKKDPFFLEHYQKFAEITHVPGEDVQLDPVYRHLMVNSDVLIVLGNEPAGELKDALSSKILKQHEELKSPFYMVGIGEKTARTFHSRIRNKRPDWHIDDEEMRSFANRCSTGKVPSLVEHVFDRWNFDEEREKKKLLN